MKYLVTGGAGFIGSHLAERLLADGHTVYVIDDLSTGAIDNISHLKTNRRFHYLIDTIANEPALAEQIDHADVVFHLAAAVGVSLIVTNPVQSIETNIYGTQLVLKHANKKKKKVILTSSSEVYGKSNRVPFQETDDMVLGPTTHQRWSYACSKAIDEFLALSYWRQEGLPVVIARLFNTVGPRQVGRYGMVIPRFIRQALSGGPITVYDDGLQSRCFTHVSDVVAALTQLAGEDHAVGQVFNVGSTEEVTILDLARRARDLVDPAVEIKHIPYSEAYTEGFEDMRRRRPDITKVTRLIGYKVTRDLDSILRELVDLMRSADTSRAPS
ncbi:MAG: GDP-mannose 4,6-dehydratase [Planctomycetota bacterium]